MLTPQAWSFRRWVPGRRIQEQWRRSGIPGVENCELNFGDIFENLDLLDGVGTIVAVRVIYHFRDRLDELFQAIRAAGVPEVVLVGNAHRAQDWVQRGDSLSLGSYARYSTVEGMSELLRHHGYRITDVIEYGDPVVVGKATS